MIIADLFIGFHTNMIFVYSSLVMIVLIFSMIKKNITFKNLLIYGFSGSMLFYLISNFGVWLLTGMYSKNFSGLVECYILAIPFLANTIISTIFFSYAALIASNFAFKKITQ